MHDLVVRGGTVVDGTGAPARSADVAITGGEVVAIGHDLGEAAEVLDATGCIVTPGFVDPHTHLDAQLFWDAQCSPSPHHGVTTVVMGNCGIGVAPAVPASQDILLRALEGLEEIPYDSTSAAVPFSWRTWAEFADVVAGLPLGPNVAAFAPHSPMRYAALGERAHATDLEPSEVAVLVAELTSALEAGALGFSTSRGPNHVDSDGRPIASRNAADAEIRALVDACEGRIWQINVQSKASTDAVPLLDEIRTCTSWTEAAGASLTWTPLLVQSGTDVWRLAVEECRRLQDAGARMIPQVSPVPMIIALGFDEPSSYLPHVGRWSAVFGDWARLGDSEKIARLRSKDAREAIESAGTSGTGIFEPSFDRWTLAVSPSRPDLAGRALSSLGEGSARPVDALFDLLLDDELRTVIQVPVINDDPEAVAELVADAAVMVGLGDSGAHVKSITNYVYPTVVLADMVRDRKVLDLAEAVRKLTSHPAAVLGLEDRGVLAPGLPADLNVIDLAALTLLPPEQRGDLPGGSRRLFRGAAGYRAVLVNGAAVVVDDRGTGAAGGRFLRAG